MEATPSDRILINYRVPSKSGNVAAKFQIKACLQANPHNKTRYKAHCRHSLFTLTIGNQNGCRDAIFHPSGLETVSLKAPCSYCLLFHPGTPLANFPCSFQHLVDSDDELYGSQVPHVWEIYHRHRSSYGLRPKSGHLESPNPLFCQNISPPITDSKATKPKTS